MSGQIVDILQFALDGVAQQQAAIANNLANVQTPNYTEHDVSFQQSLAQAIASHGTATASVSDAASTTSPASDGNNVSLTNELVAAQQATLQYQVLTDSVNAQFRLVQGAAGGSFA
ncbi:MAG: flagellar basal body rod protein FlgB [Acidimicrobiales bacterium]